MLKYHFLLILIVSPIQNDSDLGGSKTSTLCKAPPLPFRPLQATFEAGDSIEEELEIRTLLISGLIS